MSCATSGAAVRKNTSEPPSFDVSPPGSSPPVSEASRKADSLRRSPRRSARRSLLSVRCRWRSRSCTRGGPAARPGARTRRRPPGGWCPTARALRDCRSTDARCLTGNATGTARPRCGCKIPPIRGGSCGASGPPNPRRDRPTASGGLRGALLPGMGRTLPPAVRRRDRRTRTPSPPASWRVSWAAVGAAYS